MSDQTPFIPGWLDDLGLAPYEFRVLARVIRHGVCWESVRSMAKAFGASRNTISAALNSLVEKGILARSKGPGNQYCYELRQQFITSLEGGDSDEMAFAE